MSDTFEREAVSRGTHSSQVANDGVSDFRAFIDAASDFALVARLDGRIIFANKALRNRLGYDENDLSKMRILDLVPKDHREGIDGMTAAILRAARMTRKLPLAAKDGSHVQVVPHVWHGRWNGSASLFCVFKDLSAEEEAQRQFEFMFRRSPSFMALSSLPDPHFVDINEASLDRLGYSRDEVIGKSSLELGLFPHVEQRAALLDRIQRDGHITDFEVQIRRKDGMVLDGILSGDVISNRGRPFLLIRIVDITERKQVEKALRDTNSQLRAYNDAAEETASQANAANRAKSEFLAKMSHEIRTPMNAVLGFTDLLLTTNLTEEQHEYLDIVKGRGQDLLRIIDDILDLARIEADRVHLAEESFSLRETVASSLDSVRLRAEQKGLVLRGDVARDVPVELSGDPLRLRQVILNLLANAVKFTAQGSVDLRVERIDASPGPRCGLRFVVTDTGIGIPPARQQLIFEPFVQADSATARTFGGTGLGLTISRRLVEKMGGVLSVESEPGGGSAFSFTAFFQTLAPGDTLPGEPVVAFESNPGRPLHVLVVEDDPTSRMLAAMILRRDGHKVEEACDGESALHAARKRDFDLILMDVNMPVMDGLAATRAIRALASDPDPEARRRSRVPIVAATALAMSGDAERCLAAGMNRYLSKPIKADRLRACLAEFR